MQKYPTIIIGAGAAGIVAAITAKRKGSNVLLCERMSALGKKILASGAGRCNLLNTVINSNWYNPEAKDIVDSIFSQFGKKDMLNFFKELGLETYSDKGRIFPVTNQSSSVVKILEMELKRLAVPIEFDFEVVKVSDLFDGFAITSSDNRTFACNKLIITGGGRTYPALGSNGSCYAFAQQYGHTIIEPVPSAVSLSVKDELCQKLQGQKISAKAKAIIDGEIHSEESGEIIFKKNELSGTAILDISREISIALNREKKKNVTVAIDMIPFMQKEELQNELKRRLSKVIAPDDLLIGLLPNRFAFLSKNIRKESDIQKLIESLKDRRFKILGTRGWNEAEFTCGGIAISEIDETTLESQLRKNLYFAGEIIDVDGKRGGYNLAWAWASGYVAGMEK